MDCIHKASTDIVNLRGIVSGGGLRSDVAMAQFNPEVIRYDHIKKRRATEIRVGCCRNRGVGEFVPFYYCPRSPMPDTINRGNTGRSVGCQRSIVRLVSKVGLALNGAADWAISDGNAGAYHSLFYKDLKELGGLDWQAIRATQWQGRTHQKMAEFLVADLFPRSSATLQCRMPPVRRRAGGMILSDVEDWPCVALHYCSVPSTRRKFLPGAMVTSAFLGW